MSELSRPNHFFFACVCKLSCAAVTEEHHVVLVVVPSGLLHLFEAVFRVQPHSVVGLQMLDGVGGRTAPVVEVEQVGSKAEGGGSIVVDPEGPLQCLRNNA